jgi:hypothetical protein
LDNVTQADNSIKGLMVQISQHLVKRETVSMNIGEYRDPHYPNPTRNQNNRISVLIPWANLSTK